MANISKGIVAAPLAVGIASSAVAAWLLGTKLVEAVRSDGVNARWPLIAEILAPLSLISIALAFWLPNPLPARHFVVLTLGVAILICVILQQNARQRPMVAIAIGFAAVLSNQALALASAPIAARLSPSKLENPAGVLVPVPAEPAWSRRNILKTRGEQTLEIARQIASKTCALRLVIITEQAPALMRTFLRPDRRPEISLADLYDGAFQYRVNEAGREIIFIQNSSSLTPIDATALVLADEQFSDAAILVDPLTQRLVSTRPPAHRVEPLQCDRP